MKSVKFIYFDGGGTLFKDNIVPKLAEKLEIPYQHFVEVYKPYKKSVLTGKIHPDVVWQAFQDELGFSYEEKDYNKFWFSLSEPIQEMHTLLLELRKKLKIGLLTNLPLHGFDYLTRYHLVPDCSYDSIINSAEIGYAKPDVKIYEIAQKKAGVLPGEILFIDNKREFIDKAKEVGWRGVLVEKDLGKTIQQIQLLID